MKASYAAGEFVSFWATEPFFSIEPAKTTSGAKLMSAAETSTAPIIDFIGVSLDYAAGYSFLPRGFGPTSGAGSRYNSTTFIKPSKAAAIGARRAFGPGVGLQIPGSSRGGLIRDELLHTGVSQHTLGGCSKSAQTRRSWPSSCSRSKAGDGMACAG